MAEIQEKPTLIITRGEAGPDTDAIYMVWPDLDQAAAMVDEARDLDRLLPVEMLTFGKVYIDASRVKQIMIHNGPIDPPDGMKREETPNCLTEQVALIWKRHLKAARRKKGKK